jgi:hypothetical protein
VYSGPEALCSNVDVYDDALRLAGQSRVAVGHGESHHLEVSVFDRLLRLDMRTSFGQVMILGNWPFFSFWPLTMASIMEGWSLPRFTKTWETPYSHSASKNANDAV